MGWSDVVEWINVDRGDLIVAVFTLVVLGVMTWRYVKATEKLATSTKEQAKSASISVAVAEESVKVAKEAAAAAKGSQVAAYDQAEAAQELAKYARENADAASLQLAALQEQRRPYVYVDIRGDDQRPGLLIVLIENIGSTVAIDVVVAFDPPLQSSQNEQLSNKSTMCFAAVPPGRRVTYDLGMDSVYFAGDYPLVYKVRINVKGYPSSQLSYFINLEDLKGMSVVNRGSLMDIVEAIQRVESLLSNLPTAIRISGGAGGDYYDDESSALSPSDMRSRP
jgi:hypothetical protein